MAEFFEDGELEDGECDEDTSHMAPNHTESPQPDQSDPVSGEKVVTTGRYIYCKKIRLLRRSICSRAQLFSS